MTAIDSQPALAAAGLVSAGGPARGLGLASELTAEARRWNALLQPYRSPVLASSLFQLISTTLLFVSGLALMLWSLELSYALTLALALPTAGFLPGNYWVGIATQVSTAGNAIAGALSNVVYSFAGGQSAFKGVFGSSTNASHQLRFGAGAYSASSTAVPSVVGLSEIVGSAQGNTANPVFQFINYTA